MRVFVFTVKQSELPMKNPSDSDRNVNVTIAYEGLKFYSCFFLTEPLRSNVSAGVFNVTVM